MILRNNILNVEEQLYEAMKSGNIETLDNLLHNDLLFLLPSGETITKEMDLETYRSGNLKIVELIPTLERINIINDLAVVTLKINLKGNYNNQPFDELFRYIRFWKSFPEGFKVVGGSGISI